MLSVLAEWVQASPADEFWPVVLLVILACICGFVSGFWFLHRKRVLEDIPTSKIRSAAQGYLELTGHGDVMDGPQIVAPLTGMTCTWFSFSVEERRGSGKNARWVTIEKATSDGLFLIVDETGRCVIDPEGASVVPAVTETWYGTGPRPQSGHKLRKGWLSGGRFRYTERRMHPRDTLYAIGLYKTVGGANTDFNMNAEVVTLLKEWKSDSVVLLAKYDKNKDGQIDVHEWEGVRNAALQEVLDHHREFKAVPAVNVMCQTRDLRRPYILSAISQHNLIKRYTYYSGGLIALFFLTGIFACWSIGLRMYGG